MQNCNQMHACYLFQQDKHYDLSYDTGDKALQCGRHVDIFKLWLMWRAKVRGGTLSRGNQGTASPQTSIYGIICLVGALYSTLHSGEAQCCYVGTLLGVIH